MISSRLSIVVVSFLALGMAGCQSERFSRLDTPEPAPLAPAPSGNVQTSQLPPPSDASSPSAFPAAPEENTQVAALNPDAAAAAPEVTTGSVAGVWNVSVSGQSCRIATPQTKYGKGYRAGPLHCPSPMDGVKSWQVEGKQLAFYDQGGQPLARLYSSGSSRFDGQTTSGQPISLTR